MQPLLQGKRGELRGRTFSAPRKWMPGKGRITCQFGCCYNYATDAQGRPKGAVHWVLITCVVS
jgi:mRNA N6-methyladenine demethylase